MGNKQSSAVGSSRSSSRSSALAFTPGSLSPSSDPHLLSPSGHGTVNHSPEGGLSFAPVETVPIAARTIYACYPSTATPAPFPPFKDSQSVSITPPASTRHSAHSLAQQPTPLERLLFSRNPHHLPRFTMNYAYPYPPIVQPFHLLQNFQLLNVPTSLAICQPEELDHDYSIRRPTTSPALGHSQYSHYQSQGMFSGSHNLSFSDTTFIDNSTTSDNFMKDLLQHTIIGAEFDSSDRHPPPRCHPGTRLKIIERCKTFIVQCDGEEEMHWVVGPAGVGKSAIMQIVAEVTPADASIFFSVNGRREGKQTFITIAYQLAAKCEPYRQFIRSEISRDPSLLRKSLPVHFQTFIVDPFIHRNLFNPSHRYLIILDGLDECDDQLVQEEILKLISHFCLSYPTSPIVWIIASRPEPHITAFFDDNKVAPAYTKVEILIDSNEACEDVQRYLRDELNQIKNMYPTLKRKREWPSELEFTKIATAAGGLFAYASTVVRYIGDPHYHDPTTQLCRVLEAINAIPKDDVLEKDHPLAPLDALYRRILSHIPPNAMINARKLLLVYANGWSARNFRFQCNRLGLGEDAAYGAICHLHAVAKVPTPDKAGVEDLEFFHKSFNDFLCDCNRSGFSPNAEDEADRLLAQSLFRIVQQVPDNFDGIVRSGGGVNCNGWGYVKDGPGFCDNILLSWPGDERFPVTDDRLKLDLYLHAIGYMRILFQSGHKLYQTMSLFHALTNRFTKSGSGFPFYELRHSGFELLRAELTGLGRLQQVPLRALDYAAVCGEIDLRFTSPIDVDVELSDPWNASCKHDKRQWDDLPQRRGWSTDFQRTLADHGDEGNIAQTSSIPRFHIRAGELYHWKSLDRYNYDECIYCLRRLARHFIDNPDQLATVFTDSTKMNYVELSFRDPDDGVSEWRYRFLHSGPPSCID